ARGTAGRCPSGRASTSAAAAGAPTRRPERPGPTRARAQRDAPWRPRSRAAATLNSVVIGHPAWQTHHARLRHRHRQAHLEVVLRRSDDASCGGADLLLADVAVSGPLAGTVA